MPKAKKKTTKVTGEKRRCSECNKLGHNKRSHEKGGKFA